MQIGFIDFSAEERNKVLSTLKLLGEQTALDELGIGVLRDFYADQLFPGISTIQTRAKYLVLIPYLFRQMEEQALQGSLSEREALTWLQGREDRLVGVLMGNSPGENGIIGSLARKQKRAVKQKPSAIYWSALRIYGIVRAERIPLGAACAATVYGARRRKELEPKADGETYDDSTAAHSGQVLFSPLHLDYDLNRETSIRLTRKEAEYIEEHILRAPESRDIPGHDGAAAGLFDDKRDLFAVSPFLSDDVVKKLTESPGHKVLVTRKAPVTKKVMEAFDEVYITKEVLTDNEYQTRQDIHAKLYFTATSAGNYLYIGSANASHNAFYKNVEVLLRLKYRPYYGGFQTIMNDFIPQDNCPYERLGSAPEVIRADEEQLSADRTLREAVRRLLSARVVTEGDTYRLVVSAGSRKEKEPVYLAPLQRRTMFLPLKVETVFKRLLLKELSAFFIRFRREATLTTHGLWTGIPTRNVIWLNTSSRSSNGFAEYLLAMTNLTPHYLLSA